MAAAPCSLASRPADLTGSAPTPFAKRFPTYRREKEVERQRTAFQSFRKSFVRALEIAKIDRDKAALVVGHERGFTFRVYNPEGLDMPMLRDVVEAATYDGFKL